MLGFVQGKQSLEGGGMGDDGVDGKMMGLMVR